MEVLWKYIGYALIYPISGLVGGLLISGMHACFEHIWYYFLEYLAYRKLIRRLAPSIPITVTSYKKESFWAVTLAPVVVSAFVFAFRDGYFERCKFSMDIFGSWYFTWVIMILHDAYFWVVHTVLHKFKSLYTLIHQGHHSTSGDITVFSTAFGEFLDLAVTITPFYSGVILWIYLQPNWNPLGLIFLAWAMHGVNLMGHCGYDLPAWVYIPGSLGVLLTPLAQRPKHHYIHHLDPRFNRSLYFTWWDRLAGTFKAYHPKIVEPTYM
ncbi:hypothetical protein O6H91_05G032900 [Diphasiastrum complanatum]|uniref:Uncharacterized protein n=2 Tax=Diphasiastrum complanatum TaxID=34168 RepID=A0ACC2DMG6_DIPCM|nr:hypothetical protein O6H91_05G032700 [Diphasiastrum complanatum]KAJ7555340.1 hypothetical protein O6H91_05G032900 [Diphasiastrum complanatum]